MNFFSIIGLFGGLAMFLYGMRLMSGTMKENASGTLKVVMEKMTNNPFKAFLLGILFTAIIQSSTATIVITSGLVAAGVIHYKNSVGIIMGANVGTTVTGQVIRLLDIDSNGAKWLQYFKPSTLAPIALIIGIVMIMFMKFKNSDSIGSIAVGFGILFSGLVNMTNSVSVLNETGIFDRMFSGLGNSPVVGYITGATVAFILQSSSATIGILQTFAASGLLTFKAIYAVLVGIYLGDCVTTAIVCSIGAKADAKRVGIMNILFNLSETVVVLAVVAIGHQFGLFDSIWNETITSGGIANTNTVFNLGCSILLFPMQGVYIKLAKIIVKDEKVPDNPYSDKIAALNPLFYSTPAIAFKSCYDALLAMFDAASANIDRAFSVLEHYDEKTVEVIKNEESNIDMLADRISSYLVRFSKELSMESHISILNQYYRDVDEFERLGDHAVNIAEAAETLKNHNTDFSQEAKAEIMISADLLREVLVLARQSFAKRDLETAEKIEPLEEVVDDLTSALKDNHLKRLLEGVCNEYTDCCFLNLLVDIERISDVCSNIGIATIVRVHPELAGRSHEYTSALHSGSNEQFNTLYTEAHERYFAKLS